VINNQVGFTTNYLDARSSTYCTAPTTNKEYEVAKIGSIPIK
jgi:2-oxoglutarate dehydrogenase complex dehydrogenase (E1) component-like enzyme